MFFFSDPVRITLLLTQIFFPQITHLQVVLRLMKKQAIGKRGLTCLLLS